MYFPSVLVATVRRTVDTAVVTTNKLLDSVLLQYLISYYYHFTLDGGFLQRRANCGSLPESLFYRENSDDGNSRVPQSPLLPRVPPWPRGKVEANKVFWI